EVRLQDGDGWLTQAQMADLFQTSVPNVNIHLKAIYAESEPSEAATIKDYLIVRPEGQRRVARSVLHYSLDAILAVRYRVRSPRGTQFNEDQAWQKVGKQDINRSVNTTTARSSFQLVKQEPQAMTL
ncbi:DNA-binding protein, partial [mine drainage metagenome]